MAHKFLDEEDIVLRFKEGESAESIGRSLGVAGNTIRRRLLKNGLVGRHEEINQRLSTDEICSRYENGESMDNIAASLSVSRSAISARIHERGVDLFQRFDALFKSREDHPNWNGGKQTTLDGYVKVLLSRTDPMFIMANKKRYVAEHRLVVARSIERPLTSTETVHHINGVRDDNRLENLQLRSSDHGAGQVRRCGDCGSYNVIYEEIE